MNTINTLVEKSKLSGTALKTIACIIMLIDHVGGLVIGPYNDAKLETIGYVMMRRLDFLTETCRSIGRIALPIYCFLLVEGFLHTKNVWKYLRNLVIFTVISEIPFDLAFRGKVLESSYQNIFVTLSLGLLAMILCDYIMNIERLNNTVRAVLAMASISLIAYAAYLIHSDYSYKGVLLIALLYVFRYNRAMQTLSGICGTSWEWKDNSKNLTVAIAFIPIFFYNGKRGNIRNKLAYYAFYPCHLFVLYLMRVLLIKYF